MPPRLVGTVGLALVAVVALGLALRAPLATTALALMAFGVLHNVLELRYVGGRFATLLSGTFLRLLVALITGIVICRLAGAVFSGGWAVLAEIVLAYGLIVAAAWLGLRRRPWLLAGALAVVVLAVLTSVRWPAYHVVVITHLHNLVPLAFLWEFSATMPRRPRRALRVTQLAWLLAVPALILAGVADGLMADGSAAVEKFAGAPAVVAASTTPPGMWGTTVGLRFLTVFAFLQLMHFVVWVWFLPRYAPAAARAFGARVPWLRGWRAWALGLGVGALLVVLFVVDYEQGRTVYAALASYHAYLELPVLLAMLMGLAGMGAKAGR
ncbi:MAG: hypothetical protein GEV07_15110 [Streptosporangiales bacterium]|nr:hypothetical protein [Streptosporangiales bacterium]